jgi:hypothetical protein
VRSEQLTVCRVRYGPELWGKIIRIDDDPPTSFVGAPPERARRVTAATSGRVVRCSPFDLAGEPLTDLHHPHRVVHGSSPALRA